MKCQDRDGFQAECGFAPSVSSLRGWRSLPHGRGSFGALGAHAEICYAEIRYKLRTGLGESRTMA